MVSKCLKQRRVQQTGQFDLSESPSGHHATRVSLLPLVYARVGFDLPTLPWRRAYEQVCQNAPDVGTSTEDARNFDHDLLSRDVSPTFELSVSTLPRH
jgi:hypothetical protein